jgi:phage FluMu protein Com
MSNLHEIRTVKCAHCGKLRQEANHWFVVNVDDGKFRCAPLTERAAEWSPNRAPLRLKHSLKKNQQPACGQHCAQRLFERYLAGEAMRQHAVQPTSVPQSATKEI